MNGRRKWSGFACLFYLLLLISKKIGSWIKGMRRNGCDLRKWRWQLCLSWTQMMKATRWWAQAWTSWNMYRIQRGIFSWVLLQGFNPLTGIDKYFRMHLPTCVSNIIGLQYLSVLHRFCRNWPEFRNSAGICQNLSESAGIYLWYIIKDLIKHVHIL